MAAEIKFGTDGWRGVIAWDFTFENVRRVAQALADYINENAPGGEDGKMPKVFVGYDRRFMSDLFAADIASIFRSNKIDVTLSSAPISTPVAACLSLSKFWMKFPTRRDFLSTIPDRLWIRMRSVPFPQGIRN